MPALEGDFRPRNPGARPVPENTLAGVGQPHESLRQQEPRESFPVTFDFTEDAFTNFMPRVVDSADIDPNELRVDAELESDPKDLSALESAISSELPAKTGSESSVSLVKTASVEKGSTPLKESTTTGTPPSLPPPSPGQSVPPVVI